MWQQRAFQIRRNANAAALTSHRWSRLLQSWNHIELLLRWKLRFILQMKIMNRFKFNTILAYFGIGFLFSITFSILWVFFELLSYFIVDKSDEFIWIHFCVLHLFVKINFPQVLFDWTTNSWVSSFFIWISGANWRGNVLKMLKQHIKMTLLSIFWLQFLLEFEIDISSKDSPAKNIVNAFEFRCDGRNVQKLCVKL